MQCPPPIRTLTHAADFSACDMKSDDYVTCVAMRTTPLTNNSFYDAVLERLGLQELMDGVLKG